MLPDPTDVAQEQAARFVDDKLREQLQAAAAMKKREPEDPGFCDFCGEPTQSERHLFCSSNCERLDAAKQRQILQNQLTRR